MSRDTLTIRIVDAFTRRPFGGNAAGVVLDPEGLADAQMQAIAREMNLSETAFLLPPDDPQADVRVRWFTPTVEVDLCGHATVATFHAAMAGGRLEPGAYRMQCRSGILPVDAGRDAKGSRVTLGLPVPEVIPMEGESAQILDALGLAAGDVDPELPMMSAGPWAIVPVVDRRGLNALSPDFGALRRLAGKGGAGNTIVLTRDTVEPGAAVHLRMFAPWYGIDEDPVTGSAQGPVAAYLASSDLLTRNDGADTARYVAEQGDGIGRPGRIETVVRFRGAQVRSITITGRAVTVLEGTITLR